MKKRYKRDYVILDPKDQSFKFNDKQSPKAFAKIEIKDNKGSLIIFVENIKYIREGYRVLLIEENLNLKDVGRILVNENGKGEFNFNFSDEDINLKAIALTYNSRVPLIGFKGKHIDNYLDIINQNEDLNKNVENKDVEIENMLRACEECSEEYEDVNIEKEDKEEYTKIPSKNQEPISVKKMDEEYIISKNEEINKNNEDFNDSFERFEEDNEDSVEEINISEIKKKEEQKDSKEKETHFQEEDFKQEYTNIKKNEYNKGYTKEYVDKKEQRQNVYLIPRKIKKVLIKYKQVKPFYKDFGDIKWWKIDATPMTICGYIIPYMGYMNYMNYTLYSDTTYLCYKYRHYIFGINYNLEGKRKHYIYGVPGLKNEQPDYGETGFNKFIPCDKKDTTYGYWLCYIDCKSRLIALDDE